MTQLTGVIRKPQVLFQGVGSAEIIILFPSPALFRFHHIFER